MLNYTSQKRRTNSTMAKKYGYPAIYNTQINGGSTMDSMNGDEGLWGLRQFGIIRVVAVFLS